MARRSLNSIVDTLLAEGAGSSSFREAVSPSSRISEASGRIRSTGRGVSPVPITGTRKSFEESLSDRGVEGLIQRREDRGEDVKTLEGVQEQRDLLPILRQEEIERRQQAAEPGEVTGRGTQFLFNLLSPKASRPQGDTADSVEIPETGETFEFDSEEQKAENEATRLVKLIQGRDDLDDEQKEVAIQRIQEALENTLNELGEEQQ